MKETRYKTETKSAQVAGKTQETWRTQEIPHSGKFSNGLIFENFKSSQAFLKIFFEIHEVIIHVHQGSETPKSPVQDCTVLKI